MAKRLDGIWVTVRGFEKYKGRGDVKHNSWFRCSNRITEDADFFGFTHAEFKAWIYILCLASQKNNDRVFINFEHADRVCRLKRIEVESAIEKLMENQLLPVDGTCAIRARDVDDTSTCATDRQTDRQDTPSARPAAVVFDDPLTNGFLEKVNGDVQSAWFSTYPDASWVQRELKKAVTWIKANPRKAPKSDFAKFFTNWLSRGWEFERRNQLGGGGHKSTTTGYADAV